MTDEEQQQDTQQAERAAEAEARVQEANREYADAALDVLDKVEEFNKGEALELSIEARAQLAEIRSMISALKSADPDGNSSDDVAGLEAAASTILALLSSLGGANPNIAGLKSQMVQSKQTADAAISAAIITSEVSEVDIRNEKYYAVYTKAQEARYEYMREMIVQTQFYDNHISTFLDDNPAFASLSKKQKVDIAVTVAQVAQDSPDVAKGLIYVNSLTPDQKQEAGALIAKDVDSIMELYNSLDDDDPRKQRLDKLIEASGGMAAFKMRVGDDVNDLVDRINDTKSSDSFADIDKDIDDLRAQTIEDRKKNFYAMPVGDRNNLLAYFKENDMSIDDGLMSISLDPRENDTGNPDVDRSMTIFSGTQTAINSGVQYMEYGQKLGINQELIKELDGMSQEERMERLLENPELAKFLAASPEEQVEMLGDNLRPEERAVALGMARSIDYATKGTPEKEVAVRKAELMGKFEGSLTEYQRLSALNLSNPAQKREYTLGMQRLARDVMNDADLNPEGVDYRLHPELMTEMMALNSNTDLSHDEWRAARDELSVKATEAAANDTAEDVLRADALEIKAVVDNQFKSMEQFIETGDVTQEDYLNAKGDLIYTELLARGANEAQIKQVIATEYGLEDYNPSASTVLPYLQEQAQISADLKALDAGLINNKDLLIQAGANADFELNSPDFAESPAAAREAIMQAELQRLAAEEFARDPSRFTSAPKGSAERDLLNLARNHMIMQGDNEQSLQEREAAVNEQMSEQIGVSVDELLQTDKYKKQKIEEAISGIPASYVEAKKRFENGDMDASTKAMATAYYRREAEAELMFAEDRENLESEQATEIAEARIAEVTDRNTRIAAENAAMAAPWGEMPFTVTDGTTASVAANSDVPVDPAVKARRDKIADLVKMGLSPTEAELAVGQGTAMASSGVTTDAATTVAAAEVAPEQAVADAGQAAKNAGAGEAKDVSEDAAAEEKTAAVTPAAEEVDPLKKKGAAATV